MESEGARGALTMVWVFLLSGRVCLRALYTVRAQRKIDHLTVSSMEPMALQLLRNGHCFTVLGVQIDQRQFPARRLVCHVC